MSKSPELYGNKVSKIAFAAIIMSSLAIKSEVNISADTLSNHELHMSADRQQLSRPIVRLVGVRPSVPHVTPEEWEHHPSWALIASEEVTPKEFQEWSKVVPCEEGDWHGGAPGFDGLGETAKNWISHGGQKFAPYGYEATPDEQIIEAEQIQKDPPDQNGCQKGGW